MNAHLRYALVGGVLWVLTHVSEKKEERFRIVATFPDTEAGMNDANAFCAKTEGVSVIDTMDGTIYVANDKSGA